jgi:hypothetical protein
MKVRNLTHYEQNVSLIKRTEIKEDIEEECQKYGPIIETKIPRPAGARSSLGVGKIYIKIPSRHSVLSKLLPVASSRGEQSSQRSSPRKVSMLTHGKTQLSYCWPLSVCTLPKQSLMSPAWRCKRVACFVQ